MSNELMDPPVGTGRFNPPGDIKVPPAPKQLSFRVGGEALDKTIVGTLAINGKLNTGVDLNLDDELRVQVVNSLGEVVAQSAAIVSAPAFVEQRDKYGEIVAIERAHKAKVE